MGVNGIVMEKTVNGSCMGCLFLCIRFQGCSEIYG